jgi:hypothetical protein
VRRSEVRQHRPTLDTAAPQKPSTHEAAMLLPSRLLNAGLIIVS